MDCTFLVPSSAQAAYQDLSKTYSAIEPPTWALLLAESVRSKGFSCSIIDQTAEGITDLEVAHRVKDENPKLLLNVVYGQNPNSGTIGMSAVKRITPVIRSKCPKQLIAAVGSHVSALPKEVLTTIDIDIALINEGLYSLLEILEKINSGHDYHVTRGIAYKTGNKIVVNEGMPIVPQERMDIDFPGYAWDLLPFKEKPLDLYRSHFWHTGFRHEKRTPFATIYTSLGCIYGCDFCMINILNRTDTSERIHAGNSRVMRFWSSEWVIKQFKILHAFGVETLRLADEMFFLSKKHYRPILDHLIESDYDFNIWAYARVDTVISSDLQDFKKAGINWLALGIESGNQSVRLEASKGSFKDIKIEEVIRSIQKADIYVLANYILGFPNDTYETMEQTVESAMTLLTEHMNYYACSALPGSRLYYEAIDNEWDIPGPSEFEKYAFLGYQHEPLRTKYLTAKEVLDFRDKAWLKYFTNPKYLELIKVRFGINAVKNISEMTSIKLRRKILE